MAQITINTDPTNLSGSLLTVWHHGAALPASTLTAETSDAAPGTQLTLAATVGTSHHVHASLTRADVIALARLLRLSATEINAP